IIAFAPEGAGHPLAMEIIAATEAAGGEAIETSADILSKMSGKDNPQMLLGAYRQPETALHGLDRSAAPLWIVAQALRDPGNIGTILRTGDAVGAGGLILVDDCADPYSVEAVRASMGAIFTQAVASARWDEFVTWLRSGPGQLVGTSLKASADYLEAEYRRPCFLLIGNEQQGLPEAFEAECDLLVKIPMAGRADSLNAAVAAAVMAFQIVAGWRN
ncbi:MAG TPA: RNA methyltransferase, partial [Sphingomicrobium sp.]|nr:RNA methyltransferase [Sphingomicrobium sp.]